MALTAEEYLARADPLALVRRLRAADPEGLARNVAHFEGEADHRDAIVQEYLSAEGVEEVTQALVEALLPAGALNPSPALLDVGAGSGFFTRKVEAGLRARGLRPRMFAMDATPAMLRSLAAQGTRAVPFLGVMEDLEGSVRESAALQPLPPLFDGLMSTLALHHCPDVPAFFRGAARVLRFGAPMAIVDLVEHGHAEFRDMGDVHLGFAPGALAAQALEHFGEAEARVLPNACCSSAKAQVSLLVLEATR